MEFTKVEDVLKRQRALITRLRERSEAAAKTPPRATPERLMQDHEDRLAKARADLATAIATRDATVSRLESDVTRKRAEVERLGHDLEEMRISFKGGEGETGAESSEVKPAQPGATEKTKDSKEGRDSKDKKGGRKE